MDHPFRDTNSVIEQRIKHRLNNTPVIHPTFPLQDHEATLMSFINDVAMGMVDMHTIAVRYGITVEEALLVAEGPEVARRIKTKRALWESEDNVLERNRVAYGIIALDAAAVVDRHIHHPGAPANTIIDALKIVGKFAGLETQPKSNGGGDGPGLAPVTIQINFSGGKTESISIAPPTTPPTIDGEAA